MKSKLYILIFMLLLFVGLVGATTINEWTSPTPYSIQNTTSVSFTINITTTNGDTTGNCSVWNATNRSQTAWTENLLGAFSNNTLNTTIITFPDESRQYLKIGCYNTNGTGITPNSSVRIIDIDSNYWDFLNISLGVHIAGDLIVDGNLTINNITATGEIRSANIFASEHCHKYSQLEQTITNVSTYALISFETLYDGCDFTNDNSSFTLPSTGMYNIAIDMFAHKSAGPTATIEAILLLNGNQVNGTASQRTLSSNDEVGYFAINIHLAANAGDNISVGITGTNDNANLDNQGCVLCEKNVSARIIIKRES